MAASGVTVFEQNKEQLPQPKPPKDKVLLDERGDEMRSDCRMAIFRRSGCAASHCRANSRSTGSDIRNSRPHRQ